MLDFGLAKFVAGEVMQDLLAEELDPGPLYTTAPTLNMSDATAVQSTGEAPVLSTADINRSEPLERLAVEDEKTSSDNQSVRVHVQYDKLVQSETRRLRQNSISGEEANLTKNPAFTHPNWLNESPGDLSSSGIKGTPLYMAPEVLSGETSSRRSDLYSMGALLYELCVGSPPHYDPLASLEDLRSTVTTKDVVPISGLVSNIDERFAAIVERCLRRKPSERYSSGEELREALEQLADTAKKDDVPDGNPYRGLLPFEAEHRSLFFGRKSEIGTLLERLRTEGFILVTADSGVGKSSLCRAGVLPLVLEGVLGGNRTWQQVPLVPGRNPFAALVSALCGALAIDEEKLSAELRQDPTQLPRILNRQLGDGRGLILFIDQMEELVTIGDRQEAEMVGEALAALTGRIGNVRLLGTVRSDFLARLATVPGLGDEISRALYILRPLSTDKLREVVVGPAHKKGVSFESESLINQIVESTANADGGLPLLQFALAELWEVKTGDVITAAALDSIGGVEGALARHADHVISRLPLPRRTCARRILMNLVTVEGTRARRNEEELTRDGPDAQAGLEALVRGRLLVVRDTPEGAAYEVAHEALIKGWGTLRKWLEEHAESRAVKQRLEVAALDWQRLNRSQDALWGLRQISETQILNPEDIGPREAKFLAASRIAAQRRRLLRNIALAAIPVLIATIYAGFKVSSHRERERRVAAYVGQARSVWATARQQNAEVDRLRRASFAAFDSQKREEGEKLWEQILTLYVETDRSFAHVSQLLEAASTADGSRVDVREMLGDVLYERALAAERERNKRLRDDLLERMSLYDIDGQKRKQWNAPAHLTLQIDPPDASIKLEQYKEHEHGFVDLVAPQSLTRPQPNQFDVARGSYLISIKAPGRQPIRYPVLVQRAENLTISIKMPLAKDIPDGFVYIPAGRFLFGSARDESVRKGFLNTVPVHQLETKSFLIAKNETTYREWIDFLSALNPQERAKLNVKLTKGGMGGSVEILETRDGRWELKLQTSSELFTAKMGESINYKARKLRQRQDWLRMPVGGVSLDAAEAYVKWLNQSRRVLGARLCSEYEWERAARGADEREFPRGDTLDLDDAVFDTTYGRDPFAVGPDEVGVHSSGASPFGVNDMAGNVFEWVTSALDSKEALIRSGGYIFGEGTQRLTNRTTMERSFRDPGIGFRVCASYSLNASSAL